MKKLSQLCFALVGGLCLAISGVSNASILFYGSGNSEAKPDLDYLISNYGSNYQYDYVTASTFSTMSAAQISSYDAVFVGWESDYSGFRTNASWSSAITGNILISGQDPDYHNRYSVMRNMLDYAMAGSGTGFVALADYASLFNWTPWVSGGAFSAHADDVRITPGMAGHMVNAGLSDGNLSSWGNARHVAFSAVPAGFYSVTQTAAGQAVTVVKDAPATVPEPGTVALVLLGLFGFAVASKPIRLARG